MKIVINTSHQRFGGAVQVALSFIYECIKFNEHQYFVLVGPGVKKSLNEDDFPANFHFQYFDFGIIDFWTTIKINSTLQKVEREIKPDAIISTSGPTYFHSVTPQIIGYNLGLYIYPESPYILKLPIKNGIKLLLKKKLHFYFFKRDASAYVVQTEDVNKRVRKELKTQNVYTVTNTHSSFYSNWISYPNKLNIKILGSFRFITISAYYPHKNLELISGILPILDSIGLKSVEFVLTLNEKDFKNKFGLNPDKRIINIGPIKPEECPSLYNECDAMFLPTLAECFSASYPEAMVMNKPIITSDLGFARSICGNAALYFRPMDSADAANKIKRLISDKYLVNKLVAEGKKQLINFDTPEERANKYLNISKLIISETL